MKVSCIMPTADRAAFVPLAIHCFLNQTWEDRELIIIDDGVEGLAHLIPNDPRIGYFPWGGPRLTIGAKRNLACQSATGDILVNCDDDEWYSSVRISDVVLLLIGSGKQVAGYDRFFYWNEPTRRAYEYRYGASGPYAAGSTQAFYREWWKRNPYPDKSLGEDADFSFRASKANQLISRPAGGMVVARAHAGNTTTKPWGSRNYPEVPREALPAQFFRDVQQSGHGQVAK